MQPRDTLITIAGELERMTQSPSIKTIRAIALAVLAGGGVAASTITSPRSVLAAETAVAPEKNPPGDIPDSQVFVVYASPLGFSIKVPEGWARRDGVNGAVFSDKYNQIWIEAGTAGAAPTKASVTQNEAATLLKTGRAVVIRTVTDVTLPAGPAVRIAYTSNSEPNAVTGKQIRQENERYLFFKAGKLVSLDLAAPLGADNADQWKLMTDSFRWK